MKAIRFAAAGVAGMAELDMPEIAPGHALVRVRAAGLCHTDIEVCTAATAKARSRWFPAMNMPEPSRRSPPTSPP